MALSVIKNRPIRTVLKWQLLASMGMAVAALVWLGQDGAFSALLGGLVNVTAGLAFGWFASRRSKGASAGDALRLAFRAEASKIILIVMQMWLVLTIYQDVVLPVFIGAFVVTVVLFSMAIFVREN